MPERSAAMGSQCQLHATQGSPSFYSIFQASGSKDGTFDDLTVCNNSFLADVLVIGALLYMGPI